VVHQRQGGGERLDVPLVRVVQPHVVEVAAQEEVRLPVVLAGAQVAVADAHPVAALGAGRDRVGHRPPAVVPPAGVRRLGAESPRGRERLAEVGRARVRLVEGPRELTVVEHVCEEHRCRIRHARSLPNRRPVAGWFAQVRSRSA
jgi:hypothetical protein